MQGRALIPTIIAGLSYGMIYLDFKRRTAKARFIFDLSSHLSASTSSHGKKALGGLGDVVAALEKYRDELQLKLTNATEPLMLCDLVSDGTRSPKMSHHLDRISTFLCDEGREPIRNLLRFCELINFMLETKVVSEADIFPLLGYRILLVLNCPLIQKCFLFAYDADTGAVHPRFPFLSIFALHSRIMAYYQYRFLRRRDVESIEDILYREFKYRAAYDLRRSSAELWPNVTSHPENVYKSALAAYRTYR